MSIQNFDAAAFLDLPVDAPSEKRPPIPAGDYTSTIKDVVARVWQSKDKYNDDGSLKSGVVYDVTHTLEIPEAVQIACNLAKPQLDMRDGIMLEMTAEGAIDNAPGKNRALRNYRIATDMNNPGEVFRAKLLVGKLLKVRVKHEIYPVGSDNVQEKIDGVAKLGG